MKEWKKQTTVFKLLIIVVIVTSMLSACGGGSQGIGSPGTGNEQVSPDNKLHTFVGTYSDNKCWSDIASGPYSALTNQLILSPSTKPNTLNITDTYFYYQNDDKGNRCGVKIGSSVAYGEMTFVNTVPSVEFSNSSKSPLQATKFIGNFSKVVNEGVYGTNFDELDDYGSGIDTKFLLAKSDNLLYSADFDSPRDSEGFPTKLTAERVMVGISDSAAHQLNDYIGNYFTNQCASPDQFPSSYTGKTSQIVFSASDKPNTLNVTNTFTYYKLDTINFVFGNPMCGAPIGSSTAYGEITFLSTLPSVQFSNLTNPPMGADKFQLSISRVVNKGVFDQGWDEVSDYNNLYKNSLFALDGKAIYLGNYSSPVDGEGFPTQLDQYTFWIRQY